MNREHVLSDELFDQFQTELARGNYWFAYNRSPYFLDKGDVYSFTYEDEARQFALDNFSDVDSFHVIEARSIISVMRQLPYGEDMHFNLTKKELEELFQSFDWTKTAYDPLHDTIEAATEMEKKELAKMETLVFEWENLYKRDPEAALELAARYWEGKPMQMYVDDFIKFKTESMNEKNFDYLKDNIKYHGFGETLNSLLEEQLKKGAAEFSLPFKAEVNKHEVEATLHFKKSDTTDMYFFNKYDTRLKNERDETMAQTFYLNNGSGVTLKEAYNLLNGRAVHKELINKEDQKYKAWIQLDFSAKDKHGNYERKQYHENYGYDLKEALSYYPLKEMMKEDAMKDLLKSLEKGNVQMVTMEIAGKDVKVFIEANPQYKGVNLYDNKMQRLEKDQRAELMKKTAMKEEPSKGQTQGLAGEDKEGKKQGKGGKKNAASEDNGLVKKKRFDRGKGMGVH
jgi:hypothetical protein